MRVLLLLCSLACFWYGDFGLLGFYFASACYGGRSTARHGHADLPHHERDLRRVFLPFLDDDELVVNLPTWSPPACVFSLFIVFLFGVGS